MSRNKLLADVPCGRMAFSSVPSSWGAILDCSTVGRVVGLKIMSSLDKELDISFDNGTTKSVIIPPGSTSLAIVSYDFGSMGVEYSGVVKAQYSNGQPTSGVVTVSVIRSN